MSTVNASALAAERAKARFVYREDLLPGVTIEMDLKRIIASTESEFQQVSVIETYYGKTLVTDGKTQSSLVDEFAYHESLVHPALLQVAAAGGTPKSVFIGGGGELATAREVLKHKEVERVVMVDLDEVVVDFAKEHLPEWGGQSVLSDPRFELVIGDAHKWLLETTERFDAIIMDISDPVEAGPGIMLYTQEFYQHAKSLLNQHCGVFVTQAGTADSISPSSVGYQENSCYAPIRNTLQSVFDCAIPYSTNVPSFGGDWGFVMAFSSDRPEDEWKRPPTKLIDDLIAKNISAQLRFYDGESHHSMFSLTKPLRTLLAADKRVMTRDNPVFMY